jgi:hypothetical protein
MPYETYGLPFANFDENYKFLTTLGVVLLWKVRIEIDLCL